MKLISLYIENFGGLSQYSLDLSDGLTVIREDNGFGKSTLAEFIRAMFYGFPRKGKTLDKSRRQKYAPWNGNKCGGNLVFEVDGCQYRLERTFGATPKSDTFSLIDLSTARKSDQYSSEIGLELFQLDSDSFERSTYMPQYAGDEGLTTDSIRSKLSNLVEDTNDVGNFDKAMAALRAKRSAYVPYRGSGGTVALANGQISRIQGELVQIEGKGAVMESCQQTLEEISGRLQEMERLREDLRIRAQRASEAAIVAMAHRQDQQLNGELEIQEARLSQLRVGFPGAIPSDAQIEDARAAVSQLEQLQNQSPTQEEDLEAAAYLETHQARFAAGVPDRSALSDCRTWCGELVALRQKILQTAASTAQPTEEKANPLAMILLLVLGIGSASLGGILLIKEQILGYLALGIGAVCLIGSVFAAMALAKAKKKLQLHRKMQQDARNEMEQLTDAAQKLEEKIRAFLGRYGEKNGADLSAQLTQLEHDAEDYLRAEKRVAQWEQDKKLHGEKLAQWQAKVDAFFREFALTAQSNLSGQLLALRDNRKEWVTTGERIAEIRSRREMFRQANGHLLMQPMADALEDPRILQEQERELTAQMDVLVNRRHRLEQELTVLREQIQQIPELQDALRQWQEQKAEDQKKSDLLDDTMTLLEQAKENLSHSYMGPIRRSFGEYLDKLWGVQEGKPLITADLQVQLERSGAARELGYFSAGQTDMVMLCMRFALVDALFTQAQPFVILDDPFVNLDDAHMDQAMELLRELARKKQILYLTCSSSRTPK